MKFTGQAKEKANLLLAAIKLFDWLMIVGSGVASFYILEPIKHFPAYQGLMPENYLTALVLGFLFSAWLFPIFNVYKSWRGSGIAEEILTLLFSWTCAILGLMAFIFFTKTATEFSRHWFLLWFGSAYLGLIFSRITLRALLHTLRNKGFNQRHIVLVGTGALNQQITKKLESSSWMGLKVAGYFYANDDDQNIAYLGDFNTVAQYVEQHDVDQVWITLPLTEMDKIEALSRQLHSVAVDVMLIPDIASLRLMNYSVTHLDGLAMINISVSPMSNSNIVLKWLEDKILASLILILISPIMLAIAIVIKLSSPGPVFYTQERISWNGQSFNMLKFRSMPMDSDKHMNGPVWGNAAKKTTTRVGQFFRSTSLDELPQFINVLKGDMSIVGPRPERTVFVEQFKHEIDGYMQKHLVQAGITGWAQVNGWRGDTCLKTRIDYDLFYIENWSLWFDLKIIFMTLFKGFSHEETI
ncbi:hypothetical protein AU255_16725 [Methyloprofundus sedimenti]|uniref:Bacterial sugar transferase domain-containing protein n=1 Tax=Methyloprofundus sedimenti TaxID=1420851 RepID=A0A1V8M2P6_9GAMM|nr:undecaprenyl-phosphate glucose phosphotransferase [Methyloprofundus sedimenti]OQK15834.1 hypothetical protein AU255_16725 [Methyloprofundus sedimenti]